VDDIARTKAALDAEFRRVGVSWEALLELLLGPSDFSSGGLRAVGVDADLALPLLRGLPKEAGTAAFVATFRMENFNAFSGRARDRHTFESGEQGA
jgi:hypothetical protein